MSGTDGLKNAVLVAVRPDSFSNEFAFSRCQPCGELSPIPPSRGLFSTESTPEVQEDGDIIRDAEIIAKHTAFPVSKHTILTFPQGWDYLVKALHQSHILSEAQRAEALTILTESGLQGAFSVRRELINFKKLMLHVATKSINIEKALRRLSTFFYRNGRDGDGDPAERSRHNDIQLALNSCTGLVRGAHDARAICKAICCLHRLPDEIVAAQPSKLHGLPETLLAAKAISPVQGVISSAIEHGHVVSNQCIDKVRSIEFGQIFEKNGCSGLLEGHRRVASSIAAANWPAEVAANVLAIFVAHGGCKAFAIENELRRYEASLTAVCAALESMLEGLANVVSQCQTESGVASEHGGASAIAEDCHDLKRGAATLARKHSTSLQVTLRCCSEVLRWVQEILASKTTDARLFVAGDDLGQSDVVPSAFGANLPVLLAELSAVEQKYAAELSAVIDSFDAWPPQRGAPGVGEHLVFSGATPCARCGGGFHHLWVVGGTCYVCERAQRTAGRCPFRAACPPAAFCPHKRRCAVCERSSCAACRLHAGDGDCVSELVQRLRPARVYLDWDRTCCSTKNGASPLQGNHTLDEALLELLAASPPAEVVTRNSHVGDIRRFLADRYGITGVPIHGVRQHAKPGGIGGIGNEGEGGGGVEGPPRSKAAVVCRDVGGPVLFVDDDIAELVQPDIAASPLVHRVHFTRGS